MLMQFQVKLVCHCRLDHILTHLELEVTKERHLRTMSQTEYQDEDLSINMEYMNPPKANFIAFYYFFLKSNIPVHCNYIRLYITVLHCLSQCASYCEQFRFLQGIRKAIGQLLHVCIILWLKTSKRLFPLFKNKNQAESFLSLLLSVNANQLQRMYVQCN